jgi:hypothetical protein
MGLNGLHNQNSLCEMLVGFITIPNNVAFFLGGLYGSVTNIFSR